MTTPGLESEAGRRLNRPHLRGPVRVEVAGRGDDNPLLVNVGQIDFKNKN